MARPAASTQASQPYRARDGRGDSTMWARLFKRGDNRGNLQARIRDRFTYAVHEGLVAPAPLVAGLRALRRLMLRHPATNNEHTAALFIAHGFHETLMRRLNTAYRERARVLQQSMDACLPQARYHHAQGGSALWVELPAGNDTRELAQRALERGIVIEPGAVFFGGARPPTHYMRLGYSSIAVDRIAQGVSELAVLILPG